MSLAEWHVRTGPGESFIARTRNRESLGTRSDSMTKVLVLYYSLCGHIETMASAVAVRDAGVKVAVKRAIEIVPERWPGSQDTSSISPHRRTRCRTCPLRRYHHRHSRAAVRAAGAASIEQ